MNTKRKGTGFSRFAKKFLILIAIVFVVGSIFLNSYESNLNIEYQNTEKEISTIESEIDGLNMRKQELASFSRISQIATANGYTYRQSTATANVVGVKNNR